jgi:microcystin-dependent protein
MDFFLGEIRAFPFSVVPTGWHLCDGSLLPVGPNQALFSLLGTLYGGDGKTNFGIPDLRGRTMLDFGMQDTHIFTPGKTGGQETVALAQTQMPMHSHTMYGDKATSNLAVTPGNALPASPVSPACYADPRSSPPIMAADSLSSVGGQAHNNMQPSLVLNYCISTTGLYPQKQ